VSLCSYIFLVAALVLPIVPVLAEDAASSGTDFGFELGLGTETLLQDPTQPYDESTNKMETWQKLALKPDLKFGKFGVGLDLTVHFLLNLGSGEEGIEFYEPDWIPSKAGKTFFELYLPKIAYLSWGEKGESLYAKFGSFDDGTLGNGFIMGNYSNTNFLPETRLFGAALDVDGALFKFPYVGLETFAGNVARFDVIGSRLFVRPLYAFDIPLMKELQVGATVAMDREPLLYDGIDGNDDIETVTIYGGDFRLPVLANPVFSMATFGDVVFEPGDRWGTMIGAGGKLISLFTWGAQLRILGPDFVPTYFDSSYDLFRAAKYDAIKSTASGDVFAGWFASAGTTLLDDKIIFNVAIDGPFQAIPETLGTISEYPHLRGVFTVGEGILSSFSFDALYEKYYLGADKGFFQDLLSPENAVISAKVNYKTGPAVLSLIYNLRYDPATSDYIVTSSLMSSISF
jgi:hypothetical protein